ncbi:hypothetical protein CVT25_001071 [Psilocybe cyanescens]|uniref:Replication protein A C-terminal domain-containing protein n=1 Tax=Psilocybe cyanescens TaxID=93625 RepID=A0A409XB47_PSICY|nr:hypothetical protein CVT25_001071 [Psilocybe cyanescens]
MSQYESNHYGSGGGYLQGGSPFSQSGSPGGTKRTEASNSLRPFTLSQLIKATQAHTDAEWRIDDIEIGQATVVGQVVSVQKQTTNFVYMVDDGTGKMEARHWVDNSNEDESTKFGEIAEGRYVRVTGGIKSFGKKRYLNATHIREIQDPHEIYFHILEAITVNLIMERGPVQLLSLYNNPLLTTSKPSNPLGSNNRANEDGAGNLSAYSAQNAGGPNDQYSHLPPLQRNIIRFILNQPPREEGIHVAAIAKAIGASGDDAHKISAALDKLMDDGHVFTTIDDSHFNVSL